MQYLTDRELIEYFEFGTLILENQFVSEEVFIKKSFELPIMAVASPVNQIDLLYTNKKHEIYTGYSIDKIREDCAAYLNDIVHPESKRNVKQFLPEFYNSYHSHQTLSFVQYTKFPGEEGYSPLITFTKPPASSQDLVMRFAVRPGEMGKMAKKMKQVVEFDKFRLQNFRKFQLLSKREMEVLQLLGQGFNNPKIAEKLFISRQTVESHRKSIIHKLQLRNYSDLMKFVLAFALVKI